MKFRTAGDPVICLKVAGYQNHYKGFIRVISKKGDRFHALLVGQDFVDLHFDKVKTNRGIKYHSAAPKPAILKGEIRRIKKVN